MDWKLAMKEERAAMQPIVALLFALADLAESASRRSGIVRAFVLWVLRWAETVAWDFIIDPAEPPPCSKAIGPAADSPAEALRLAQSFRDLACELDHQARFAFAIHDAIHDDAARTDFALAGTGRALSINDFLNSLQRLVFAANARRVASATGPPDTS